MKLKILIIILCLILLVVICRSCDVSIHNNDILMVSGNISKAIISYNDDRLKEAHNALYFDDEKIRSLYDPYYESEQIKGYYYYNSRGVIDIRMVNKDEGVRIEESTREKYNERTNILKNKKSKYDIVIYRKDQVPEEVQQWIGGIKTTDHMLYILEYNGKLFGYCQSPNGFGYSYDKTLKSNSLTVFVNPCDDSKDDHILFSIPCKEYSYVELEN